MPLSTPAPREMRHRRTIQCSGYRRADGMWDIEGYLLDVKTYDFPSHGRGEIKAGEPFHEMWIRLTVDEEFLIHDVEAVTDNGPTSLCGAVASDFNVLKGLHIGKGFNRRVKELLGGVHGCVHLVDLLGPIATAAFQTLYSTREAKAATDPNRSRPPIIDQCHALASDGELVKLYWPQFYTGP
ncbi:MAG: DUF2889 domain-containing protein [Alphaproteobacteria bacterium]|nr:DUF2889 domain-containing protein [Alphaproteobacteria bacterium]